MARRIRSVSQKLRLIVDLSRSAKINQPSDTVQNQADFSPAIPTRDWPVLRVSRVLWRSSTPCHAHRWRHTFITECLCAGFLSPKSWRSSKIRRELSNNTRWVQSRQDALNRAVKLS